MNQNKYKDNYITVVKAIQNALINDTVDGYTRLYVKDVYKLSDMPYLEMKDIIKSMHREGFIEINHEPLTSEFVTDDATKYHPPAFQKDLEKSGAISIFPRPIWPMNYFSVTVENKFKKVLQRFGKPLFLLNEFPQNKKNKVNRKILTLLLNQSEVEGYSLGAIFKKEWNSRMNKNMPISRKTYNANKKYYDELIRNRLKTVNKKIDTHGYTVNFRDGIAYLNKTE